MTEYLQYEFFTSDSNEQEWLMALLSEINFEGFEQTDVSVLGYVTSDAIQDGEVRQTLNENNLSHLQFAVQVVENKNWNEEWERNFSPVIIAEKVGIRAPFHPPLHTEIEIIIEPKMSFGTGHHPTTALVIEYMLQMNLQGKTLLDIGAGSGILSILAHKLGVDEPWAIDHDEWAYQNAMENIRLNNAHVKVLLCDASISTGKTFDVIVANINRQVVLNHVARWSGWLNDAGILIISGFLFSDVDDVTRNCISSGLQPIARREKGEWAALMFRKV
jgi:ribosomal protein L11 methyltransferase